MAKRLDAPYRAGRAHDDQGEAPAHGRLRRRRLPLAQERRRARWSARCCSGSTTTRARCITSASRRPSRTPCARQLVDGARAAPRERARRSSVARVGRGAGRGERQGQRLPGATSRWNRGKDLSWEPLRPERVCEVAYDHMQGTRFRHATQFVRWRPDKPPSECRYDQLEVTPGVRARAGLRARGRADHSSDGTTRTAPGIVVGIGRLLGRALGLGDVAEVEADARPGASSGRAWRRPARRPPRAAPPPRDGAPSSARARRARPPCARPCATVMSGWVDCRRPAAFRAGCRGVRRRDGATRAARPPASRSAAATARRRGPPPPAPRRARGARRATPPRRRCPPPGRRARRSARARSRA